MTTIAIPQVVRDEVASAMKEASWKLARQVAAKTHNEEGDYTATPAEIEKIDALMNLAAELDGVSTREWATGMIQESVDDLAAANNAVREARAAWYSLHDWTNEPSEEETAELEARVKYGKTLDALRALGGMDIG